MFNFSITHSIRNNLQKIELFFKNYVNIIFSTILDFGPKYSQILTLCIALKNPSIVYQFEPYWDF